jgi:hypothetical protein
VLAAVGVVFQLPIFILALVRLGVLSTRAPRRNRRAGHFLVAVVGVLLPGVDPVTTMLEALPLFASTRDRSGSPCCASPAGTRRSSRPPHRHSHDIEAKRQGNNPIDRSRPTRSA